MDERTCVCTCLNGTLSGVSSVNGALSGSSSVTGTLSTDAQAAPYYDGEYQVTPELDAIVLDTSGKLMRDDVIVRPIPVTFTSNPYDGLTVLIG